VTLWNKTAEVAAQYLGKGSPVLIEGKLKLESWETDGQKRTKLKVVGERMQMLGGKKEAAVQQTSRISGGFSQDSHDEIPF
jgi:single-strand DNA-binding protein